MSKTTAEANKNIAYRLSNNLPRLLREFSRDFERRIWRRLAEGGYPEIRPAHVQVFANLGMGSVRVSDLAERAQITQQAMGKMLKELERLDFIARDIDAGDKRAKEIRLTDKGIRLAEDSMRIVDEVQAHYRQQIGSDELEKLEEQLRRVVDKLQLEYLPESWAAEKPS